MKKNDVPVKVLVMCLADPSGDPRPLRAVELCVSLGFDVSVMGYPARKPLSVCSCFTLPSPSPRLLRKVARRLWGMAGALLPFEQGRIFCEKKRFGLTEAKTKLCGQSFDLLIVEDPQLLPFAFEIKRKGKILFDAREYYPRQNEGELWFDLFEKRRRVQLCRDYLTRCENVVTVSEGLRREFLKEFGVDAKVYRSTPSYIDFPAHATNPEKIRMIYHGAANRNRRLENLIEIVSLLDERFSLDLILTGNPRYQQELRRKAASMKRVGFPAPVPFEEIIPTIGKYDIGFFYYEPTGFNIAHCLPNKFFEYIQTRLMVAIGPSPDMAELVNEYRCGVVAEEFSVQSMAKTLNSLSAAKIDEYKQGSDKAARELCFEKERDKMISILNKLLGKNTEEGRKCSP